MIDKPDARLLRSVGPESENRGGPEAPDDALAMDETLSPPELRALACLADAAGSLSIGAMPQGVGRLTLQRLTAMGYAVTMATAEDGMAAWAITDAGRRAVSQAPDRAS